MTTLLPIANNLAPNSGAAACDAAASDASATLPADGFGKLLALQMKGRAVVAPDGVEFTARAANPGAAAALNDNADEVGAAITLAALPPLLAPQTDTEVPCNERATTDMHADDDAPDPSVCAALPGMPGVIASNATATLASPPTSTPVRAPAAGSATALARAAGIAAAPMQPGDEAPPSADATPHAAGARRADVAGAVFQMTDAKNSVLDDSAHAAPPPAYAPAASALQSMAAGDAGTDNGAHLVVAPMRVQSAAGTPLPFEMMPATISAETDKQHAAPALPAYVQAAVSASAGAHAVSRIEIATPIMHPAWADEAAPKLAWMIGARQHVAEMHINPPQLGPLDIRLTMDGNQTSAVFTSPHSEVRDALESGLPRLREVLAESGITLGNASVTSDSPRDQRAYAQPAPARPNIEFAAAALPAAHDAPRRIVGSSGMVDLYA